MVQGALAKTTRVCSYDRAGLGLSQEARGPRDLDAMAPDLAVVVKAAGKGRPVVLVGQSLGGAIVLQFAYRHPEKLAGVVMVDSVSDHEVARSQAISPLLDRPLPSSSADRHCLERTEQGPIPEGSPDYQSCVGPPPPDMPAELVHYHVQYSQSPAHYREAIAEREALLGGNDDAEADAVRHALGDVPMVVLTGGEASRAPFLSAAEQDELGAARYKIHDEVAHLSTRGRHRIVQGSGHNIQYDRPQAVIEAVAEVLADAPTRRTP